MRSPGFDVAFCKVAGMLFSLDHILIENPCPASISTNNLAEITCMEWERVIKRCRGHKHAAWVPRVEAESSSSCCVHSENSEMLPPTIVGSVLDGGSPVVSPTLLYDASCAMSPSAKRRQGKLMGHGWRLLAEVCSPQPQQPLPWRESHQPSFNMGCTSLRRLRAGSCIEQQVATVASLSVTARFREADGG